MKVHLGIDVGSVSTNIVALDGNMNVLKSLYIRTNGRPIVTVQKGLEMLVQEMGYVPEVLSVGTTGSGRHLASVLVGADCIKNEITAHAVAASSVVPEVQTVLEIGGQDSKIIILREGVVADFAMNTVCAAGTGSFLDQQAARLNIPIEQFGPTALQANTPVRIAGRCTVFAESDMIHKQQMGHSLPDILAGLCDALVRNYLNNVGKGKDIQGPIVFQGGVAANIGIREAFKQELGQEVIIPPHFNVMGAIGAAILGKEAVAQSENGTKFRGFTLTQSQYRGSSFECQDCPNGCEVIEILCNDTVMARWGDRCNKWSNALGDNRSIG